MSNELHEHIKALIVATSGSQAGLLLDTLHPETMSKADQIAFLIKELSGYLSRVQDESHRKILAEEISNRLIKGNPHASANRGATIQISSKCMLPLEEVQDKVNKQFFGKGLVGIIEFYDYNNAEGDFLLHISKVESLLHSCLRNHDLLTQISDTQALVLLLDTDPRLAPVLANRVDTSARNKGFKVKGAFQSFSAGFDRLAVFNKVTGDLAQQMASVKLNEFLFK